MPFLNVKIIIYMRKSYYNIIPIHILEHITLISAILERLCLIVQIHILEHIFTYVNFERIYLIVPEHMLERKALQVYRTLPLVTFVSVQPLCLNIKYTLI
jgi:hypothetical protein